MSEISYCGALVRDHDRDRFLLSLFAPADRREAVWALFAFNHEIAKTREVVSDATLGRIRLQWWEDAIGGIYAGPPLPDGSGAASRPVLEHEVVKPLADAIRTYDLPREEFEALIVARAFDVEGRMPENIDEFLSYAESTSVPLLSLALRIIGFDSGLEPVQAVGLNYAIAGLLRAAPFRPGFVPGEPREIAAHFVPKIRTRVPFLRAVQVLARLYMKQMKGLEYDVFSPKMAVPPAFKELRVMLGSFLG